MNLAPLAPLFEHPGPWASVYVDTPAADEATAGHLGDRARRIAQELAEQGADDATCLAVREALGSPGYGAGHPGMAVFAAHGKVVLDPPLTLRLPAAAPSGASVSTPPAEPPPPADSAVTAASGVSVTWAPLPHLAPLLDHAPDEPLCLVAYVDRTGADFEVRTAGERGRAGRADGWEWPVHRTSTAEWVERQFPLTDRGDWAEGALLIASALQECVAETGAGLVILAGSAPERRAVHEMLPQYVRGLVIEAEHGGRSRGTAPSRLSDEDVDRARHAFTERRTHEELDRFLAARTPTSGHKDATEGVPALLDAAREHRIAELLLSPEGKETRREVWVGPDPDQLAVRRAQVEYLGAAEPSPARADDALLRSAAMAGAEAVLVHPAPGTPAPLGGLGALLRWPGQGQQPMSGRGFGRATGVL